MNSGITNSIHSGIARKVFNTINRLEAPKAILCRIASLDVATGVAAHYSQHRSLVKEDVSPILKHEGQIFCLVDKRYAGVEGLLALIEDVTLTGKATQSERLHTIREAIRAWSIEQVWTAKDIECFNALVLIIQPESIATLLLGKAQIRYDANRLRARNLLSVGMIQGFVQAGIKSYVEERVLSEPIISNQNWSWQCNENRIECRYEKRVNQGVMRFALIVSDIWLPTEVNVLARAAFLAPGGVKIACETMRKQLISIGESLYGSLAVMDILPQELDTPDANDALNIVTKAAKFLKTLKTVTFVGIGLLKFIGIMSLIGVLALVGYGIWTTLFQQEMREQAVSYSAINNYISKKQDSAKNRQMLKNDSISEAHALFGYEGTDDTEANTLSESGEKIIIAIEKTPRSVVPILLKTKTPIAASNLASKVSVTITGPQIVTKYRVELDTMKRELPLETTRLNVIIEQPLAEGKYIVKLTLKAEETTNETVNVNVVSEKAFSNSLNIQTLIPGGLFYGRQVVLSNKWLKRLSKQIEASLNGGSIEELEADMSLDYRFYYQDGDSSLVQSFRFDRNVLTGIQRGWFIPASTGTVRFELVWQYPKRERLKLYKKEVMVYQRSPEIIENAPPMEWRYRPRPKEARRKGYLPYDIEVTLAKGIGIEYEVPVNANIDGSELELARKKDLFVPDIPTIELPKLNNEAVALYGDPVTKPISFLIIFNEDNERVLPETIEEYQRDPIRVVPLTATYENERYTCRFLITNLPPKPKEETWRIAGQLLINTSAYVANPYNGKRSSTNDPGFLLPIMIKYK